MIVEYSGTYARVLGVSFLILGCFVAQGLKGLGFLAVFWASRVRG